MYLCGGERSGDLTGADVLRFPNEMQDWGGVVHLPYEGAVGCDLFIKPEWLAFHKAHAEPGGSLSRANFGIQIDFINIASQDKYRYKYNSSLGRIILVSRL